MGDCLAVAVGVGRRVGHHAQLEPALDELIDQRPRAGQEPPAIGPGAEAFAIRVQDRGSIMVRIDGKTDEQDLRVLKAVLKALHHGRDSGARERTAREDERDNRDLAGKISLGDASARAFHELKLPQALGRFAKILRGGSGGRSRPGDDQRHGSGRENRVRHDPHAAQVGAGSGHERPAGNSLVHSG